MFFTIIEEFEDTKGVIGIRKSKNRQHDGRKKKDKQRSTKHTHKTKERVTIVAKACTGTLANFGYRVRAMISPLVSSKFFYLIFSYYQSKQKLNLRALDPLSALALLQNTLRLFDFPFLAWSTLLYERT